MDEDSGFSGDLGEDCKWIKIMQNSGNNKHLKKLYKIKV